MAQREGSVRDGGDYEADRVSLLHRLEALELLVYGRSCPAAATSAPGREVEPLLERAQTISKSVTLADGGSRDLQELVVQASNLGLMSPPGLPTTSASSSQNIALKENILYTARGEIQAIARLLSQVNTLQEHVNPHYLRDMPQLTSRLSRLEGNYIRQATEASQINESAENARLHYSEVVKLVSEKFVNWDDQVAKLERRQS